MPAEQQKDGTWRIKKKDGTIGKRKFSSKKNALAAQRSGGAKKKPGKKVAKKGGTKATTTTGSSTPGTGKSYQAVRLTALAVAAGTDQVLGIVLDGKDVETAGRDLIEVAKSRPHLTHIGVVGVDLIIDKSRKVGQAAAMSRGSVTAWAPEVYDVGMGVLDAFGGASERQIHNRFISRTTGWSPIGNVYNRSAMRTYRLLKHGGQLIRIGGNRIKILQRVKRVVQENILRPAGVTL
jgi:hypothetical protein